MQTQNPMTGQPGPPRPPQAPGTAPLQGAPGAVARPPGAPPQGAPRPPGPPPGFPPGPQARPPAGPPPGWSGPPPAQAAAPSAPPAAPPQNAPGWGGAPPAPAAPKPGGFGPPPGGAAAPKPGGFGPPTAAFGKPPAQAAASSDGALKRLKLGEWLVALGLHAQEKVNEVVAAQQGTGRKIGELFVQRDMINEKDLEDLLTLQELLGTHSSISEFAIDPKLMQMVPPQFAKQNGVIPFGKIGRRLVVGMSRPDDVKTLDSLSLLTGFLVVPVVLSDQRLKEGLSHLFEKKSETSNQDAIARAVKSAGKDDAMSAAARKIEDLGATNSDSDAPIIELVNSILNDSIESGTSDIHLEARENYLEVRFRMDGVLTKMLEVPKSIEMSVCTRFMVLSNMNITEKRRPQDGRFSVKSRAGDKIDFRVSMISTHFGMKLCLRLLRPMNMNRSLTELGFDPEDVTKYQRLLHAPSGIILVTGPTGSGKSSTLYASLGMMSKDTESVITIEDPVEFPCEGISQIQVNPKIDLTFAAALRTILRQDPDVIMVGEIRDHETCEAAVHAAMTGHLVLSTLHTNDAVQTINRLIEMGVPPYMVSSTVTGVVAQRLLRRVCLKCKIEYQASAEEREFLGVAADAPCTLAKGEGCEHCKQTGFKGQLAIFEIFIMSKRLQSLINSGESVLSITEAAKEEGMTTLMDDGKRKALKGSTTVSEVQRICGLGES